MFISFKENTADYSLPEQFTYPFYYEPHPLCLLAAKELQTYLETQTDWVHNFGINPDQEGLVIGKMFGVLVVQNQEGNIGYLAAFSGKLAGGNQHARFVPPIFDMLEKGGFFRQEEEVLNALNRELEILEAAPDFIAAKTLFESEKKEAEFRLAETKAKIKAGKKSRKERRKAAETQLFEENFAILKEELRQESLKEQYFFKDLKQFWEKRLGELEAELQVYLDAINAVKQERKGRSYQLQNQLFDQYQFLNIEGKRKGLRAIFEPTVQQTPPAGAGECAAPKLLQYAFEQGLKPVAMAEFWWGAALKSAVRKHGQFYPACRGKCEPILKHMLAGIEMDENPMLTNPAVGKKLDVVYEDAHLLLVNKPPEFLSVPGKTIQDSVALRMKQKYPKATGPMVVHRLDMSTSGLMLIAKTQEVHKYLQYQFIKRTIKKRYIALLYGRVETDTGLIDLPLRVDLDNRPQQLVCYDHGKSAQTKWQVLERSNGQTRIHFFPITGRTHQLRVHAAHPLGLNTPIIGDDLYGKRSERLHLHAEYIQFRHPETKELMEIEVAAAF